jgi:hypothetical protein
MTTATIDAEADLLAWTGFLRRHHQRLNAHHFGGRLAEPTIEWADLDDGTNATFGCASAGPRSTAVPSWATPTPPSSPRPAWLRASPMSCATRPRPRCTTSSRPATRPPTTAVWGFRAACATVGIAARPCSAEWLYL